MQTEPAHGLRIEDDGAVFHLDYNDREWVIYLTDAFLSNLRRNPPRRDDEEIIRENFGKIVELARDEIDQLAGTPLDGEVTVFIGRGTPLG
jgi:hypothetical protein